MSDKSSGQKKEIIAGKTPYDDDFYQKQIEGSLRSARIMLGMLWKRIQPDSILDVGCGRGAWLKACREFGASTIVGLDGDWNRGDQMIDDAITFRNCDLNKPIELQRNYDLAISLEVAEHLEPLSARSFIGSLTAASDLVLFSAAYSNQGGTYHINEQPHTYWAKIFIDLGYLPFDAFRPYIWDNEQVEFWYRQNVFLYAKNGTEAFRKLQASGLHEMSQIGFLDCIHPKLFEQVLWETRRAESAARRASGFTSHALDLIPSLIRAVRARSRKAQSSTERN